MVVTSLSEIAWLLNIRGNALPYGPFLKAFVIVSKDQLRLYTDATLPNTVRKHLYTEACVNENCVRYLIYIFLEELRALFVQLNFVYAYVYEFVV